MLIRLSHGDLLLFSIKKNFRKNLNATAETNISIGTKLIFGIQVIVVVLFTLKKNAMLRRFKPDPRGRTSKNHTIGHENSMDVTATVQLQHIDTTADGHCYYKTLQHLDHTADKRMLF